MIERMSDASHLSAAELNERIRQLWARARGRRFTSTERNEYHRLVAAWAAAERSEVVKAA